MTSQHLKKSTRSHLVVWLVQKQLARNKVDAELRLLLLCLIMLVASVYITSSALSLNAQKNVSLNYGAVNQTSFRFKN